MAAFHFSTISKKKINPLVGGGTNTEISDQNGSYYNLIIFIIYFNFFFYYLFYCFLYFLSVVFVLFLCFFYDLFWSHISEITYLTWHVKYIFKIFIKNENLSRNGPRTIKYGHYVWLNEDFSMKFHFFKVPSA